MFPIMYYWVTQVICTSIHKMTNCKSIICILKGSLHLLSRFKSDKWHKINYINVKVKKKKKTPIKWYSAGRIDTKGIVLPKI